MALKIVRSSDIARILLVCDGLRVHREAVRVPLAPVAGGAVRIEKGVLVIEAPEEGVDAFVDALADRIRALPEVGSLKPA